MVNSYKTRIQTQTSHDDQSAKARCLKTASELCKYFLETYSITSLGSIQKL